MFKLDTYYKKSEIRCRINRCKLCRKKAKYFVFYATSIEDDEGGDTDALDVSSLCKKHFIENYRKKHPKLIECCVKCEKNSYCKTKKIALTKNERREMNKQLSKLPILE